MRDRKCLIAIAFALAILAGCAGSRSTETSYASSSSWGARELVDAARDAAYASMKAKDRREAKETAEQGIEYAGRCLMTAPEEPGCYYWQAVNTGLYYKIHVIGYQKGIKRMISDCNRVIALDPKYDHAGAYRMLGEIYALLPETAGRPDSVTRDLDRAEEYLRQAVRLAPSYPENHLALADVLFKKEKVEDALDELTQAKELTPQWRTDVSYDDWRDAAFELERRIARAGK